MIKTILNTTTRYFTYKVLDATTGHLMNSVKIDKRRKYSSAEYAKIVANDVKQNYGIDILIEYITEDDFNTLAKLAEYVENDSKAIKNSINFFLENKKIREFKSDIKRHNDNYAALADIWKVINTKIENTKKDGNIIEEGEK